MRYRRVSIALGLILVLLAGACAENTPTPVPTFIVGGTLTPYWTPTPSRTVTAAPPQPTVPIVPSSTPLPTATPFVYTIKKNDTLGALAIYFGSSVQEIEAANPGINANLLKIGDKVIIPLHGPEETPTVIPTPTPIPVGLGEPYCYASADGGAWCFTLARNDRPVPLENLSAWISLQSPRGENLAGQSAVTPLNLLPEGKAMPLVAYFTGPLAETYTPRAELLTALPAVITDTRYISAAVQLIGSEISASGLQAVVHGEVTLTPGRLPTRIVWVMIVAYAADGRVVGVKRWEAEKPCEGCQTIAFEATVFSLGPAIERVEVLAEARP